MHQSLQNLIHKLGVEVTNKPPSHSSLKKAVLLEELVAELGAQSLAKRLGLPPLNREALIHLFASSSALPFFTAMEVAQEDAEDAVDYIFKQAALKRVA